MDYQEVIRMATVLAPFVGFLEAIDSAIEIKGCDRNGLADYIEANPGCFNICPLKSTEATEA